MTIRERILKLMTKDCDLRTATEVAHAIKAQPATVSSILCRMAKGDKMLRIRGQRKGRWAWYYMPLTARYVDAGRKQWR
jgi:hypothetical protein